MKGTMKKLLIPAMAVVFLALVGGNVMAKGKYTKTIKSDPDYKASTDLSIGAEETIRAGTWWELKRGTQ